MTEGAATANKRSLSSYLPWIALAVSLLGLLFGSGVVTRYLDGKSAEVRAIEVRRNELLVPIEKALEENRELFEELSGPNFNEPGWGTQESYYEKVRRDGEAAHRIMRGKISHMVDNNTLILNNLTRYDPYILTLELRKQAQLFRRHAVRYNTRWPAMTAAAETGADRPIAEPVFPQAFPAAVRREIQVLDQKIATSS
jgi:glutathione S-transferase